MFSSFSTRMEITRTKSVIYVPTTLPASSHMVSYNRISHKKVTGRLGLSCRYPVREWSSRP
jgi:hypothetical protein